MLNHSENIKVSLPDGVSFEMIFIEGGIFEMGADDISSYEKPIHQVKVSSFYLAQYPVTQVLYNSLFNENPSRFQGAHRPVEMVSWDDVQQFLSILNKKTGQAFRLPSESEWEYAAKGGQLSEAYKYAGSDDLNQVGWYAANSGDETKPVGLLLPNELGLYDMSGNVWEWCEDDLHQSYKGAPVDGSAWVDQPNRGAHRVFRGGSYFYGPIRCRPSNRRLDVPGNRGYAFGFRLALSPS